MSAAAPRPNSEAKLSEDSFSFAREAVAFVTAPASFQAMSEQAAMMGVNAIGAWLTANRTFIDATSNAIRDQQDAMLSLMRDQLASGHRKAPGASGKLDVAAPLNAYRQVSDAFLEAQRSALRAWSGTVR